MAGEMVPVMAGVLAGVPQAWELGQELRYKVMRELKEVREEVLMRELVRVEELRYEVMRELKEVREEELVRELVREEELMRELLWELVRELLVKLPRKPRGLEEVREELTREWTHGLGQLPLVLASEKNLALAKTASSRQVDFVIPLLWGLIDSNVARRA